MCALNIEHYLLVKVLVGRYWLVLERVRHVVDSFNLQNVSAPKGPSSVAKGVQKQIINVE